MKKFKVGQKLRVIDDGCIYNELYRSNEWHKPGAIVTVAKLYSNGQIAHLEEETDCGWAYDNEWYEPLKDE